MYRISIGLPVVLAVLASTVLAGCSDTVRLPDCIDCRPVEMGAGQTLEVELGSDRAVTNDPEAYFWILADPGTMTLESQEEGTRSEDPDEFIGGYSRYVLFRLQPTEPGTTHLQFQMLATGTDGPAVETLDITVEVSD